MAVDALELALTPLTPVWAGVSSVRRAAYAVGALRRYRLPMPVISVGNLSFGGSGKTPTVIALARDLVRRGRRPAVLSRGFGRDRPTPMVVVGPDPTADPAVCGDEPLEIARALPGVPVVVDSDRVRGGHRAAEIGADVVLLDDGFQHLRLERDRDLVLLPADDPWAGGHLPPRGRLRERPTAIRRATAALVTGLTGTGDSRFEQIQLELSTLAPSCPVIGLETRVTRMLGPDGQLHANEIGGRRVVAFAGLARPQQFSHSLQQLGAEVVASHWFADHHTYQPQEVEEICAEAAALEALPVTTRKDAVKLGDDVSVWVVEMTVGPVDDSWDHLWTACGGVP